MRLTLTPSVLYSRACRCSFCRQKYMSWPFLSSLREDEALLSLIAISSLRRYYRVSNPTAITLCLDPAHRVSEDHRLDTVWIDSDFICEYICSNGKVIMSNSNNNNLPAFFCAINLAVITIEKCIIAVRFPSK